MAEIFSVPMRGIGKPDYSTNVSSGKYRPGMLLGADQALSQLIIVCQNRVVVPYVFPWFKNPVGIGGSITHVNSSTGFNTLSVPAGYAISLLEQSLSFDQDSELWLYFDGILVGLLLEAVGGSHIYASHIVGITSRILDPYGLAPHTVALESINCGGGVMKGGSQSVFLIEAI